jgi:hypothetical protein
VKVDIKIERISIPEWQGFKLTLGDWQTIGKLVVVGMRDAIGSGERADGMGALKSNKQSTIRRKLRQGKKAQSLIDEYRRFVSPTASAWSFDADENGITITPSHGYTGGDPKNVTLAELVDWLQDDGYRGFFAVSRESREAIRGVLRKRIDAWMHEGDRWDR